MTTTSTTATRLITLIMILQRRTNQKAADLANELGISVRQLHRYFGMLDEMGIPIYAERGPYGGFSLVRGYKLPPLIFNPEEAVALYLGTSLVSEMWGQLYRDSAAGALAKLENVLPDEQRTEITWARASLVTTGMHRADPIEQAPHLEVLRRAAREGRQVDMAYQGTARSQPTQRVVDTYALVHRTGWWYLVGNCHLRNDLRTFRVDRVQSLELLSDSFQKPEDFDVHEYLGREFADQPVVRARLRFTPEGAHIAKSNFSGWESLSENSDGSVDISLTAPDLPWLASLTLGFANMVEVLEPPELREMVCDWARSVVSLYEEEKK